MDIRTVRFIIYVRDQRRATDFYGSLLRQSATLDVPGMSEFTLEPGVVLGLMPESGIARIISPPLAHPERSSGVPRCELYLEVDGVDAVDADYQRALSLGALAVSPPAPRNWGHRVGYVADPDGHVIAFAAPLDAHGETN